MDLLIATRNPGKLAEIRALFSPAGISCIDLAAVGELPPIVEDAADFAGNAVKKAVMTAMLTRRWTLADDSGLEVVALGGAPGVHSARYAGEHGDDLANNLKLLKALAGVGERSACFRCVLALAAPSGHTQIVEGRCNGRIAFEMGGSHGFGYDPLFIPNGFDQTLAELGALVKQRISHRAVALGLAIERWGAMLAQAPPDWPARGQSR